MIISHYKLLIINHYKLLIINHNKLLIINHYKLLIINHYKLLIINHYKLFNYLLIINLSFNILFDNKGKVINQQNSFFFLALLQKS